MLVAMLAVVASVALYFATLRPLEGYRESAYAGYISAAEVFQDVSGAAAELERRESAVSPATPAAEDRPVRVTASATARQLGLGITRIQPINDDEVSFWLDGAGVRDLFRWMVALETEHGVRITKADIQKSPGGETVQAQVVLRGTR